ncbi:UNVERIFIED_CONTAM: Retrovirus-related Pol polyprotein from transposon RE2 [Sesamum radiatum]|uniref:Retrovirus-related Pol polyprotein from transposon RE2 n=1 Tax=Sesamum radiatum TaxID=300843 RepID=A0AAW2Q251_SESRA
MTTHKVLRLPHLFFPFPYLLFEDPLGTFTHLEPRSYAQASSQKEWQQAMREELNALDKNETWDLVDLPKGKRPIGCKWVFRVKLKPTGEVERYKARLVAKEYNQVAGVDYIESFSPVAKCVTMRLLLAVATARQWAIHQLDINSAFLHGFLEEDIYMHVPEWYVAPLGKVCRLKRSLYGLKQASRQWNLEFTAKLLAFGFQQSPHDHCLFTKGQGADFLALLVYVDDVLLCGSSSFLIDGVKSYLDAMFTIKDLGYSKYFLGLETARAPAGTTVTQTKYVLDLIADIGLTHARTTNTPLPVGIKLTTHADAPLIDPNLIDA